MTLDHLLGKLRELTPTQLVQKVTELLPRCLVESAAYAPNNTAKEMGDRHLTDLLPVLFEDGPERGLVNLLILFDQWERVLQHAVEQTEKGEEQMVLGALEQLLALAEHKVQAGSEQPLDQELYCVLVFGADRLGDLVLQPGIGDVLKFKAVVREEAHATSEVKVKNETISVCQKVLYGL